MISGPRCFSELDPGERREWLRERYADVRGGKLRAEDLPGRR